MSMALAGAHYESEYEQFPLKFPVRPATSLHLGPPGFMCATPSASHGRRCLLTGGFSIRCLPQSWAFGRLLRLLLGPSFFIFYLLLLLSDFLLLLLFFFFFLFFFLETV